eukprot:Em0023g61a
MVSITPEIEFHVRNNDPWSKLPLSVKQTLGNIQSLYDKAIVEVSIKNQLRWRNNLVRQVRKEERKYYESLLQYSREHLMLYPYHLQDMLIQGLRDTPFGYYCEMMFELIYSEKSYDSLPNFTAADCLRLLGIGRNQYIDLMNQYKAKKFFRRKSIRDLLPTNPVKITEVEPWWVMRAGYITEDDIKICNADEHSAIDRIIDSKELLLAGSIDKKTVLGLYNRGLVYFDVPILDRDIIVVPPLQGFVMNRVQGDYFETLLYKVFVSIDERTSMADLATMIQVDLEQVKNAVSVFIRLGFAYKKSLDVDTSALHQSWLDGTTPFAPLSQDGMLLVAESSDSLKGTVTPSTDSEDKLTIPSTTGTFQKRIAFLFDFFTDSFPNDGEFVSLGKLTDEALDSFLTELSNVSEQVEGEARRYFEHALALRNTIKFLRHNPKLVLQGEGGNGLDLLRCESIASLDPATIARVLQKNYSVLVSMAPLSQEVQSIGTCLPPHLGPPTAEMNSIWFKLWLYHKLSSGPPSLLLGKGYRLRRLPTFLKDYSRLLVTTWGHDATVVHISNILLTINDALTHSAVLVQAHGWREEGVTQHITFPLDEATGSKEVMHACLQRLQHIIDLKHTCGYITMLNNGSPSRHPPTTSQQTLLIDGTGDEQRSQQKSTISAFLKDLQDLGIGDQQDRVEVATSEEELKGDGSIHLSCSDSWVPLEMSFGIPLFNEAANNSVCNKILECGLLDTESLKKQKLSNRLLVMDVLQFIGAHQDTTSNSDDIDNSPFFDSSALAFQPVPMPTRNLMFLDGTLKDFNGN